MSELEDMSERLQWTGKFGTTAFRLLDHTTNNPAFFQLILMWADLTGSAGSQPLWEGARDHVTSRVASRPSPSFPPPLPLRPPSLSPPEILLVAHHFVFIIHENTIFFLSSSFPLGKQQQQQPPPPTCVGVQCCGSGRDFKLGHSSLVDSQSLSTTLSLG
jgi:hypothetical protein